MSGFGLFLLMFAALCGLVALIRALAWLTDVREAGGPVAYARQVSGRYVKDNAEQPTAVMSRSENESAPSARPSLGTDGVQASDGRTIPIPTPEQMLDIFKVLREAGVKRDRLAPAWRAAGLPLSNDVWRDAAPPEPPAKAAPDEDDDTMITPFAGRRTKASYYPDDPALEYQAPTA